jgi:hypothetical protein
LRRRNEYITNKVAITNFCLFLKKKIACFSFGTKTKKRNQKITEKSSKAGEKEMKIFFSILVVLGLFVFLTSLVRFTILRRACIIRLHIFLFNSKANSTGEFEQETESAPNMKRTITEWRFKRIMNDLLSKTDLTDLFAYHKD